MKLEKVQTEQKLRGGYYTPPKIAKFLLDWCIQKKESVVLEPSCGDGVFIELINNKDYKIKELFAVESLKEEYEKTLKHRKENYVLVNSDFFKYFNNNNLRNKFDAVVGNPPYVRYQFFKKEQREEVGKIYKELGLNFNKLTNLWVPFIIASVLGLKENGRIGMVIPAELLQVTYAQQLRDFLSEKLSTVTIITFKQLVFPGVQQEVVLLMGENKSSKETAEINIVELDDVDCLDTFSYESIKKNLKKIDHKYEKWTKYYLSKKELSLLRKIDPYLKPLSEYCDIDVGIVTGANKYFVVNQDIVDKYALKPIALKLVGRTTQIPSLIFTKDDWKRNNEKLLSTYLLDFANIPNKDYSNLIKEYIQLGEDEKINLGYKTGIRNEWYKIPSIWKPEGLFLRRINTFPKIVLNSASVYTTDTMHRFKMLKSYNINSLAVSFMNVISFIYAELEGRSYGGGVLELPPNEAEAIRIPYFEFDQSELEKIDGMIRKDKSVLRVIEYTNRIILEEKLNISKEDISVLMGAWKKLQGRRLNRKNGSKKE